MKKPIVPIPSRIYVLGDQVWEVFDGGHQLERTTLSMLRVPATIPIVLRMSEDGPEAA